MANVVDLRCVFELREIARSIISSPFIAEQRRIIAWLIYEALVTEEQ